MDVGQEQQLSHWPLLSAVHSELFPLLHRVDELMPTFENATTLAPELWACSRNEL